MTAVFQSATNGDIVTVVGTDSVLIVFLAESHLGPFASQLFADATEIPFLGDSGPDTDPALTNRFSFWLLSNPPEGDLTITDQDGGFVNGISVVYGSYEGNVAYNIARGVDIVGGFGVGSNAVVGSPMVQMAFTSGSHLAEATTSDGTLTEELISGFSLAELIPDNTLPSITWSPHAGDPGTASWAVLNVALGAETPAATAIYDARELAVGDGAKVGLWPDLMSGWDMTQTATTPPFDRRPTYRATDGPSGMPTVEFDSRVGADGDVCYLRYVGDTTIPLDTDLHFFAVVKAHLLRHDIFSEDPSDETTFRPLVNYVFGEGTGDEGLSFWTNADFSDQRATFSTFNFGDDPDGDILISEKDTPYTIDTWTLLMGHYQASPNELWINKDCEDNAHLTVIHPIDEAENTLGLGSANFEHTNIFISEARFYQGPLTDAQIMTIRDELLASWGFDACPIDGGGGDITVSPDALTIPLLLPDPTVGVTTPTLLVTGLRPFATVLGF